MSSILNAAAFTALPWVGGSITRSIFNVDNQLDHWFNVNTIRINRLLYSIILIIISYIFLNKLKEHNSKSKVSTEKLVCIPMI